MKAKEEKDLGVLTGHWRAESRVFTAQKEQMMDVPENASAGGREIPVVRGH